jgi:hypothetical protein
VQFGGMTASIDHNLFRETVLLFVVPRTIETVLPNVERCLKYTTSSPQYLACGMIAVLFAGATDTLHKGSATLNVTETV